MADQYDYDAWGNILNASGDLVELNPLTYRGYLYEEETGLYYLQSRYFNPEWGRFLNADNSLFLNKEVKGLNLFAYCSNNPVSNSDPKGNLEAMDMETFGEYAFVILFGRAIQINYHPETVSKSNQKARKGMDRRYRGTKDCIKGIAQLLAIALGMAAITDAGITLIILGAGGTIAGVTLGASMASNCNDDINWHFGNNCWGILYFSNCSNGVYCSKLYNTKRHLCYT